MQPGQMVERLWYAVIDRARLVPKTSNIAHFQHRSAITVGIRRKHTLCMLSWS